MKTKAIFFSKQSEINSGKEKFSFESIGLCPIKFHSIPKHQLLSVAKNKLDKTIKAFEQNLANV